MSTTSWNGWRLGGLALLAVVAANAAAATAQTPDAYESPPVLQAADLLDPSLLEGPHHRIDPEVFNDGFMNHFTVRSDFGDLPADSEEMLAVRVREVGALARLSEISRLEAFADALKRSAMKPVTAVESLVNDPKGTLEGIPGGVSRKLRGLYYKARKTAHKAERELEEARAEARERDAGPTGDAPEAGEANEGGERTRDKVESTAKKVLGYESARRELARALGVDPYSTNPVLRDELDRLASAAFAGGLSLAAVAPDLSLLAKAQSVDELVWSTSSTELERRNERFLDEIGVDKDTRFAFLDNRAFTTSTRTRLVEALRAMDGTADLALVASFAAGAESEQEARFFTRAAEMLAGYHRSIAPLDELRIAGNEEIGEALAGRTADGTVVVAVPVDYLIWQPGMQGGPLAAFPRRELWVSGRVSPRAERELVARGWKIETRVSFGS